MSSDGESRLDYLRRLSSMGFTLAPKMLCRGCACPMDYDERAKSKNLRLLGTSAQRVIFRCAMNHKYGRSKQLDNWFNFL